MHYFIIALVLSRAETLIEHARKYCQRETMHIGHT